MIILTHYISEYLRLGKFFTLPNIKGDVLNRDSDANTTICKPRIFIYR